MQFYGQNGKRLRMCEIADEENCSNRIMEEQKH
jgi:hypothetical protein